MAAGAAALALAVAPAARAATDTWTGQGPASSTPTLPTVGDWQNPSNWAGGTLPADGDALVFGPLAGCSPTSAACYASFDTLGTRTATNLSIADNLRYRVSGANSEIILDPATGDGLDAQPADGVTSTPPGTAQISVPLVLGGPQTWSVAGGGELSIGRVASDAALTRPAALDVTLSGGAQLYFAGPVDAGPLTVSGHGTLGLSGTVNTGVGDGPITVDSTGLALGNFWGFTAAVGSLTFEGSTLTIGADGPSGPAVTDVAGSLEIAPSVATTVELEGTGTTPGADYGQVVASGNVTLGGTLALTDVSNDPACPTPAVGTTDTFISTTGTLSGEFSNLPDGAITTLTAHCAGATASYPVQITYTPHSVVGTFLSPSPASPGSGTTTGATTTDTGAGKASGSGSAGPDGSTGSGSTGSATVRHGKARITGRPRFTRMGVRVRLSCARGGPSCAAVLRLVTSGGTLGAQHTPHHAILLGSRRTMVRAGHARVLAVRLNAAGRRILTQEHVVRAELILRRPRGRAAWTRRVTLRAVSASGRHARR